MSSLSQDDFRKLLATPRPVSAAQTKKAKEKTKPVPATPKEASDDAVLAKPDLPKRKKKEWKKPDAEDPGVVFRDRAKERREGYNPDYEETEKILQTLKSAASLEDDTNLSYEQSKYLGGDVSHTHMVKGLDFALLSKMKNELELKDAEKKSEIDALNYLEGLHGDDDRPKFQSAMAENIFDIVVNRSTHRHPKKIDTFIHGRSAFVFDIHSSADDIPTLLFRSKAEMKEEKRMSEDDEIIILKLIKLMENRRSGHNLKDTEKKGPAKVGGVSRAPVKPAPVSIVEDDGDDIFADAGADYKLEVNEKHKGVSLGASDDLSESESEGILNSEKQDANMFDPVEADEGDDGELQALNVKELLASSTSMFDLISHGMPGDEVMDSEMEPKTALTRIKNRQNYYGEDLDMSMDVEYEDEEFDFDEQRERRRLKDTIKENRSSLQHYAQEDPTQKSGKKKDATLPPKETVKKPKERLKEPAKEKARLNRELEQIDKVMTEKYGKSLLKKKRPPPDGDGGPSKKQAI